MSANVTDLGKHRARRHMQQITLQADSIRVYYHLLREDAVSLEALSRALRGTGLAIRTDSSTGADVIYLDPYPTKPAA